MHSLHAPHHAIENVAAPLQPSDSPAAEKNRLLRTLPAGEYAQLLTHLEPVEFASGLTLWQADARIHSVYFPRTCVLSLLKPLDDEPPVEAATVGREGMVGTSVALGVRATGVRAIVQVSGTAARMDADRLVDWIRTPDNALFPLLLRAAQALQEQTAQSVACNRRHGIDERCARWLLMTQDRVGEDRFALTQEFLAFMLGVRRASVTVAAGILQQAGLIRYHRGTITVVDRARLESASCECYQSIHQKYEMLLGEQPTMGG
jgi:CRP-like cAMP-binding protein